MSDIFFSNKCFIICREFVDLESTVVLNIEKFVIQVVLPVSTNLEVKFKVIFSS